MLKERKIKSEILQRLETDLSGNKKIRTETRFYYRIPLDSGHSNHEVNPTIAVMAPKTMKKEVQDRIGELVARGTALPYFPYVPLQLTTSFKAIGGQLGLKIGMHPQSNDI